MANMIPISTVVVGSGGASSIEFANIPQSYTDLILKISARSDVNQDYGTVRINGDASTYSMRVLSANGSTASSGTRSDSIVTAMMAPSSYTASSFSNNEFYFPNYAGSNQKSYSSDGVTETNSTTAEMALRAHLWATTSPITSIKYTPNSGSLVQYSTATLYGIRKY